ncbi:acyl-CoA dehydrogenase family protein [Sphingobium sp. BS19]|uniref:acyl-CoA dehydrogenase family protein n=1 Tax=Sphingobium sp. BS19 TaxID=3018973 RepID=UPI002490FEEB|nr:acyl-CoA dehydrogenase family protein [Sphingobium sp. BS19]
MMLQPTFEDTRVIVEKVSGLLGNIGARVAQTENLRKIPQESIDELANAGLFRLYQPSRFGGLELPYGPLQLEISTLLGSVCASTAWVQGGIAVHAWMLGTFPAAAQEAVWGNNPDARIATAFSYADCSCTATDGGYLLSGTWQFSSGIDASDWVIVRAPCKREDGSIDMRIFACPTGEVEIVDVWQAVGMRGTGSNDVKIGSLFVPAEHSISLASLRGERTADHPGALYSLPFATLFPFAVAAPAIGIARGALAYFAQDAKNSAAKQQQLTRQLIYAQSSAEVDAAESLLLLSAEVAAALVRNDALASRDDKALSKRNTAYAPELCRRAIDRLTRMLGAHGVNDDHPIQRANRDMITISSHFGLNWDNSAEIFGRQLFGLEPTDPMI